MISLYPDQSELLDAARAEIRAGHRSVLIQAPTGSGKTVLSATMAHRIASRREQAFFVVHRRELLHQTAATFDEVGIKYGYCAAGFLMDRKQPIQICSIQTLVRRVAVMPRPSVIFFDEAHHVAAQSWASVAEAYPDAYRVGLTATPARLDGTGLRTWFSTMVCGPSTAKLIEVGRLAPFRLFAPSPPNLSGLHTKYGDYVQQEVDAAMDKPSITGDAVSHYKKLAMGKRAIAFCCSIKHSQHVATQFNAAGIVARHIDGDTEAHDRDSAIRAFRAGTVQVLTNVSLVGEGFDCPSMEVAILLRPTQSLGIYLQQAGRALRVSPGKTEAVLLDHAGNAYRHGLPDDEREWTLDGRAKKAKDADDGPKIKMCPKCYAAVPVYKSMCKHCGHVFTTGVGREVEQREGELVEVEKHMARVAQGRARSEAELIELGRARKMRRPELWARHVIRAREAKRQRERA